MKLKLDLEYVQIDDQYMAVPVGNDVNSSVGMIKMSKGSKEIFDAIEKYRDPNDLLDYLLSKHPDESRDMLSEQLCAFLNILVDKGILDLNV